jgi:hypothetical protein
LRLLASQGLASWRWWLSDLTKRELLMQIYELNFLRYIHRKNSGTVQSADGKGMSPNEIQHPANIATTKIILCLAVWTTAPSC